jgi:hypothetical protein
MTGTTISAAAAGSPEGEVTYGKPRGKIRPLMRVRPSKPDGGRRSAALHDFYIGAIAKGGKSHFGKIDTIGQKVEFIRMNARADQVQRLLTALRFPGQSNAGSRKHLARFLKSGGFTR